MILRSLEDYSRNSLIWRSWRRPSPALLCHHKSRHVPTFFFSDLSYLRGRQNTNTSDLGDLPRLTDWKQLLSDWKAAESCSDCRGSSAKEKFQVKNFCRHKFQLLLASHSNLSIKTINTARTHHALVQQAKEVKNIASQGRRKGNWSFISSRRK